MEQRIEAFKQHVTEAAANPEFVHHRWFVKYHLELVERIAQELLVKYSEADADLVMVLVWLHDYGKILDFDNQYEKTLEAGPKILKRLEFAPEFVEGAAPDGIGECG
jgi:HD superfamily phosphodiesterase